MSARGPALHPPVRLAEARPGALLAAAAAVPLGAAVVVAAGLLPSGARLALAAGLAVLGVRVGQLHDTTTGARVGRPGTRAIAAALLVGAGVLALGALAGAIEGGTITGVLPDWLRMQRETGTSYAGVFSAFGGGPGPTAAVRGRRPDGWRPRSPAGSSRSSAAR